MTQPRIAIAGGLGLLLVATLVACNEQPRHFKRPAALTLTPKGGIVVSDFHHHRVVELSAEGELVRVFGQRGLDDGDLWQAWKVLAMPDGRILVSNQRITSPDDETDVFEVKVFRDGEQVGQHILTDGAKAPKSWMDGPAPGLDGKWLVADTGLDKLVVMSSRWKELKRISAPEGGPKWDGLSVIVRVGNDLWVAEQYAHRIRRLSLDLKELARFGSSGSGPGQLKFPTGVSACDGKWAAVADLGNYRVQRFDPSGAYLDEFAPKGISKLAPVMLLGIAVTADCQRIVLVDSKGSRILVTTPKGEVLKDIRNW